MADMTDFNENDINRDASGKFASKTSGESDVSLNRIAPFALPEGAGDWVSVDLDDPDVIEPAVLTGHDDGSITAEASMRIRPDVPADVLNTATTLSEAYMATRYAARFEPTWDMPSDGMTFSFRSHSPAGTSPQQVLDDLYASGLRDAKNAPIADELGEQYGAWGVDHSDGMARPDFDSPRVRDLTRNAGQTMYAQRELTQDDIVMRFDLHPSPDGIASRTVATARVKDGGYVACESAHPVPHTHAPDPVISAELARARPSKPATFTALNNPTDRPILHNDQTYSTDDAVVYCDVTDRCYPVHRERIDVFGRIS